MRKSKNEKNILIFTFLVIPVLLMLLFVVYPAFEMIRYSLTDWNGASKTYNYIGIENYLKVILENQEIWLSLKNNLVYLIMSIIFIPIEILFAIILNDERKKVLKVLKRFIFFHISLMVLQSLTYFLFFIVLLMVG